MDSSSKVKCFDGTGDVQVFITRVKLVAAIKGYEGEKKAQFLASLLMPPAFDVYMRLSDDDKKDPEKIEEGLLKEFQRGQLNREEAIHILNDRVQKKDESPPTFAYKLIELVKLAYPAFAENIRLTIAKDYFVKGVHPDMQVALKSWGQFEASDIHATATETVRLELAGIKSFSKTTAPTGGSVNSATDIPSDENLVDAIAAKVLERLNVSGGTGGSTGSSGQASSSHPVAVGGDDINYTGQQQFQQPTRGRNNGRRRGSRGRGRGGSDQQNRGGNGNQQRSCRNCRRTDHFVRDCPQRFCQACGNRGHDRWTEQCPNYQP